MIFTGIKRKSNQLFFNKKVKDFVENGNKQDSQKVKNIIVLFDENEEVKSIVNGLSTVLGIDEKAITTAIVHQKMIKGALNEDEFSPKDFGWYGKIKSEELKDILTKKYDLLINYSKVENLYTNLVLLQCKSAFKVGFAHLNNQFYDLLIDCESSKTSLFNNELKKYLTILNKI